MPKERENKPSSAALEALRQFKENTTALHERWERLAHDHPNHWVAVAGDWEFWCDTPEGLARELASKGVLSTAATAYARSGPDRFIGPL